MVALLEVSAGLRKARLAPNVSFERIQMVCDRAAAGIKLFRLNRHPVSGVVLGWSLWPRLRYVDSLIVRDR